MFARRFIGLLGFGLVILLLFSELAQANELTIDDQVITFTDISKTDRSIVIDLPADATVSYFSFNLVGPKESGTEQPYNISLDIGDNGTIDWALKQEYGSLGYQNLFNNIDEQLDLRFILGNYNRTGGIYLPATAEVDKAEMELIYSDENYISPSITELNQPEWHPEAPYDYDPTFCIFQDRLYVAYRSYGWHDTNQSDADIALNSTSDGMQWQNRTTELTKAPDTEVPYLGGKRSGDFNPSMMVFKDHLYCAWESDSLVPTGSTHDNDRDILWTRFNGQAWEPPHELTAPLEHAAEEKYSMNPGIMDDRQVQLCTFDNGSGEQLFAIWVANNTGDEKFPGGWIGDIVISRTTDGEQWTTGVDFTFNDRRYYNDTQPQLVEFKTPNGNALFAFWVTDNNELSNGSDLDIVYRFTLDGVNWSDNYNLIEACGIIESDIKKNAKDMDPTFIVFENQLYAIWRTSNPSITKGSDADIVMTYTSDGINWSSPIEVTPSSDTLFNNKPKATVYNNKLAISWRTEFEDDSGAIVLRVLNNTMEPTTWAEPVTVSPLGVGGDDFRQDTIAFKNKLMVVWVTQDNNTALGEDSDVVVRWLVPRDGEPEIALEVGNTNKYKENWLMTKTVLSKGTRYKLDFTAKLQQLLQDDNWLAVNKIEDEFENDYCLIPINTYFSSPGRITLRNLNLQYNYTISVPDLSKKLTAYLKSEAEKIDDGQQDQDNTISVVLRFQSDSNGEVKIENLKIIYTRSEKAQWKPEVLCIMAFGIILIIAGLLIRFVKVGPKKGKKGPDKPKPDKNTKSKKN